MGIVQDNLDKVEDKYIDPLKDKIDEASKKPLSFMKEHGAKVVLGFIGVVVVACVLIAVL